MADGWFKLPGRTGERSLMEQLKGLAPALAVSRDKSVLDLGCAEGLIAMEFARAGASWVQGVDCNEEILRPGLELLARASAREPRLLRVKLAHADLRDVIARPEGESYDIVLALAILHKLPDPEGALHWCADVAEELLVIRHQGGSRGRIRAKHYPNMEVDSCGVMPGLGFRLERAEQGPRDELVHYWKREAAC